MTGLADPPTRVTRAPRPDTTVPSPAPRPRYSRAKTLAGVVLVALAVAFQGSDRRPLPPASGATVRGTPSRSAPVDRLRLATFNIHGGRDGQKRRNLPKTATSLTDVDVVALNEVRGYWHTDQAAQLGAQTGLASLFAPAERRWWRDHWGNGLLANVPVARWERAPLDGSTGKGYRNYLLTEIKHFDRPMQVLVTHVSVAHHREPQLRAVIDRFLALPEPAVLMGDLNSDASDAQIERLRTTPGVIDGLGEALRDYPRRRIDWIFVRGLRVVDGGFRDDGASDHPCFWIDVAPVGE